MDKETYSQLQLSLKRNEVDLAAWKMLSLLSELKPEQSGEAQSSSLPALPPAGDNKDEDKFSQLLASDEGTPRQLDLFLDWQGDGDDQ